jgi:hypothetical protein
MGQRWRQRLIFGACRGRHDARRAGPQSRFRESEDLFCGGGAFLRTDGRGEAVEQSHLSEEVEIGSPTHAFRPNPGPRLPVHDDLSSPPDTDEQLGIECKV